jgi:hypothetical protein
VGGGVGVAAAVVVAGGAGAVVGRGATGGGCAGVLSRGATAGASGLTGRDGSVGSGVPCVVLCVTVGGGEDEGVRKKISADNPTKPMAIAAAPYTSILPSGGALPRGSDRG